MKRLRWWWALPGLALVLAGALLLAGQAGLLQGQPPTDLGLRDGRLKPPASTPNSVSSQADLWPGHVQQADARIAPLAFGDAPAAAWARLAARIAEMPGAAIVEQRDDYLRAEFTTPWLKFVDDAEFWLDPEAGRVHLRSASRLGRSDLGANRARIEALRRRFDRP